VNVSPTTASVEAGKTASFNATVDGAAKTAGVTWSVQEPNGGTVNTSGLYTAGTTAGTYHVVATSVLDGTKSAASTVTVTPAPAAEDTGCGAVPTPLSGAMAALVFIAWLAWRRRERAPR
jgi:uncharacterized protein (TIGR03382 family)